MKARRIAAAVGVSALAVAGATSTEPAGGAQATGLASSLSFTRTIVQSYDKDRAAGTVGDQYLFTAELRDRAGALRGLDRGFCTTVAAGVSHCRQSLTLGPDQLDLQGSLDQAAYAAGTPQALSISGGSGTYATAHGQATLTRTGPTTSTLVVRVDPGGRPSVAALVLTQTTDQETLLDRGLPGRGAGDETLFAATLRDASGAVRGRTFGVCLTVTDGNGVVPNTPPFQAQCQESLVLGNGKIELEGYFDETAYDAGQPQTLPVAGGTGSYDHAHGTATLQRTSPTTRTVRVSLTAPGPCTASSKAYTEQGIQFTQIPDETQQRGAGDLLTSTSQLLDPAPAGTTHAYFLTVADTPANQAPPQPGSPYIAQTSQSNRIAGGSVNFGGIFNQTDFEAFVPQTFVVNGGTGAYEHAHGTATVRQVVFPATFELQLELACDPPGKK